MDRALRGLFLILPLLAGCASQPPGAAPPLDLREAVRSSQLVFRGTVRQVGAVTMPEIPVSQETAVVTVDEVISAPASLGDLKGRDVTVALRRPGSIGEGRRAVFFAESWIYGAGLAVREVERMEDGQGTAELREAVEGARRRNEEQDLAQRLAQAELVVVGRIARIVKVPREEHRLPLTEHDPELHRAFLEVEAVLKGEAPREGPVSFLFAASRDIFWYRSPKPEVGQAAVWILFRDEKPGLRIEGVTAFDPRDVQPRERAEAVRRLLATPQKPAER